MSEFVKFSFVFLFVVGGLSMTGLDSLSQEEILSDELIADEYGTYHIVISNENEKDAFYNIPAVQKWFFTTQMSLENRLELPENQANSK